MSSYLIDTDWATDYLKGVPLVVSRLQALVDQDLAISVISVAELYEGVYGSKNMESHLAGLRQFLERVVVVGLNETICQTFGRCRHQLRQRGELIDNFDLLIAATCLTHGFTLVTGNLRHYSRIPDLQVTSFTRGMLQGSEPATHRDPDRL